MSETAQSYDSYMDTLLLVLDVLQPVRVFEWGSGRSTQILGMYHSVDRLVSVEHDKEWYERARCTKMLNTTLILQPDLNAYVKEIECEPKQDLIFVDGKSRNECLKIALEYMKDDGVVMLHDAARSEYVTSMYPYKILTDDGHTATLLKSKNRYNELYSILNDITNMIGVKS